MIFFFTHNPSHPSIIQTYMWDKNYVKRAKEASNFYEIYGHKAFQKLHLNFYQLFHYHIASIDIHCILIFNLKNYLLLI